MSNLSRNGAEYREGVMVCLPKQWFAHRRKPPHIRENKRDIDSIIRYNLSSNSFLVGDYKGFEYRLNSFWVCNTQCKPEGLYIEELADYKPFSLWTDYTSKRSYISPRNLGF